MLSVLDPSALTTLENLKAALNVNTADTSEDPYLERLINRATSWIESETERRSPDGKYGLKARRYNGAAASAPDNIHGTAGVPDEDYVFFSGSTKDRGGDTVTERGYGHFYLPAWPVQANTVLTFQLATLSDRDSSDGESWDISDFVEFDDYIVDCQNGILRLINGPFSTGVRNYRVQMNNVLYFAVSAAALALGDRRLEGDDRSFDLPDCSLHAAHAAAHWCRRNDRDPMSGTVFRAKLAEQVPILRDIVGNPFSPATADPCWLTSTVVSLARTIYADRRFDRLPILADALEEAGCDDTDLLDHCRGDGPHVRGCWVIDMLLGKE